MLSEPRVRRSALINAPERCRIPLVWCVSEPCPSEHCLPLVAWQTWYARPVQPERTPHPARGEVSPMQPGRLSHSVLSRSGSRIPLQAMLGQRGGGLLLGLQASHLRLAVLALLLRLAPPNIRSHYLSSCTALRSALISTRAVFPSARGGFEPIATSRTARLLRAEQTNNNNNIHYEELISSTDRAPGLELLRIA